ncbi:MAG: efflux RND transporter periplasmic adaptor subunit [Acidobacteria bacterium]|nr:MAG: efflux RND transporter periplasmic adaptor subunit [Acidobacteriota bacterium]
MESLRVVIRRTAPLALAAALAGLAGCGAAGDEREQVPPRPPAVEEERTADIRPATVPPVRVTVLHVEPQRFVESLVVTATLEAWRDVTVSAEFGGTVRSIAFDKGETVRAGQELARVGDDLARAQLAQAEADLMAAEANYAKVSRLFERQAVPKQDLVAATSTRDRARAVVDEMKARLERAVLRAPIDGVVLDRPVEPGEVVPPGTPIARIETVDRLKAVASVPDTEAAWLEIGRSGTLTFDAWPGRSFPARIAFVSPAADRETRTFLVELAVDNTTHRLRPGMVGRASLARRVLDDALVVPFDAVLARAEGSAVFVVDDDCTAVLRPVEIGALEGDRALVAQGLAAGEAVVVEGQHDLVDGQRVLTESCR